MIESIGAVSSYARAAAFAVPGIEGAPSTAPAADAPDFAGMVGTMVGDAGATLRAAEQAGARQVAGSGNLIDVVTAVGSAELALNTMVAVRDRIVGAYNEIMRMQV